MSSVSSVSSPAAVGPRGAALAPGVGAGHVCGCPPQNPVRPCRSPILLELGHHFQPPTSGPVGTPFGYASRAVCAQVEVSFVLSCLSWNLRGAL